MSEFADRFFGAIVISVIVVVMLAQHRTSVHVYDAEEERAMTFVECLFDKLPEGDFSNEQYDQAERDCRVGKDR